MQADNDYDFGNHDNLPKKANLRRNHWRASWWLYNGDPNGGFGRNAWDAY